MDASVKGLKAEIAGRSLRDVARDALAISQGGLSRRARPGAGGLVPDETHFLNALHEIVESGVTPAEELLAEYYGPWNRDLTKIYAAHSY